MQIPQLPKIPSLLLAAVASLSIIVATAARPDPGPHGGFGPKGTKTRMKMTAGTVFDLQAGSTFPWSHQVRGLAQVSNLGNCRVFFAVLLYPGTEGHAFDVEGTLTVTTTKGDKLESRVVGYADPDLCDASGTTFTLHYDVRITGGTGPLAGASGFGEIDGAFVFADSNGATADPTDDAFCDAYAGVATWGFEGVLILPHPRR